MTRCTLLLADEPRPCLRPSVIELQDRVGVRAWGCDIHGPRALRGIEGAIIVTDLRTTDGTDGNQP